MSWSVETFRLVSNRTDPGLFCAKSELTLGGTPLLIRTDFGFRPRPLSDLQRVFEAAYGADAAIDAQSRLPCLQSIARALDSGDLAYATILCLMLRLPDIDPGSMQRLGHESGVVAAKYDDAETRDWHGRWTSGGGGNSQAAPQRVLPMVSSNTGGVQATATHLAGRWPDMHRENPSIVPAQIAIPIPIPPIYGGAAGSPKPKDDDFVYPPPVIPQTSAVPTANDNATTDAHAATDNNPRTCPDPSFEADSVNRSPGQLHYQAQISGLPLGMGVMLNGIKFDGCRESDGTMLEAKTTSPWFFEMPNFVFRTTNEYSKMINQAFRQISAAGSRKIEWHFSDQRVAEFWRKEFALL